MTKFIIPFFLLLFILLMLFQCATRSAPTGGPVDRTPPVILETDPPSNTTDLDDLKTIRVTFSERMDEGSLARALFISPPVNFDLTWKRGKYLELNLKDSLKARQTYVVSIGSDASDERRNKMENSFHFAFSTGAHIDQGQIFGRVYGTARNETATLFAYQLSSDTVDISRKPDYISQSGADGRFSFNYLQLGTYRIFAVSDQNRNLRMDTDYERIGIPYTDVSLDSSAFMFRGLNFRLSRSDTLPPQVLGVRPIHNRYIQLRMSESVLIPHASEFTLQDSLSLDTLAVLAAGQNIESPATIDIFTNVLDTSKYFLILPSVSDSSGNHLPAQLRFAFNGSDKEDTTGFRIVESTPKDSSRNIHPEDPLSLEFSNPVNWDSLAACFSLMTQDSHAVDGTWIRKSVYDAEYVPVNPFIPDSSFSFSLHVKRIHDVWGNQLEDSSFFRYFTVIPERELGEISGSVKAENNLAKPIVLTFRNLRQRTWIRRLFLKESGSFLKKYVPEGSFLIDGFADVDGDGSYSSGRLFPFQYSEPFIAHPDTVKVRKRWETSDINLTIPAGGERP